MDSRFPTQYLNDRRVLRAKPDEFRFFVLATAWSVTNMTDGRISQEDLYLIPFADQDAAAALVRLGLWIEAQGGWIIVDFERTQTSAAKLEAALINRRKADADRQRKKYEKDKAKPDEDSPDPDPSPIQSSREDHVKFEGKERQGKERQGKASFDEGSSEVKSETLDESDPWLRDIDPEHRCSVAACPGLVTPYLKNTYGQVCANHAPELRNAS